MVENVQQTEKAAQQDCSSDMLSVVQPVETLLRV